MAAWILIANASVAHLYHIDDLQSLNERTDLTLVDSYEHALSRKKDIELTSDKLGHFHAKSSGYGDFIESSDPKDYEAENFAKELVGLLEKGRVDHDYHQLVLVAPPHFYGFLNKHMNDQLNQLVSVSIKKDYTKDKHRPLSKLLLKHIQENP